MQDKKILERSVSKTQQRLMGQAYAYKTGDLKDLNPDYADEIKKLAKSMTQKQLKDFAGTKHKGLPEKVEEKIKRFDSFNESLDEDDSSVISPTLDDKIWEIVVDLYQNHTSIQAGYDDIMRLIKK